MSTRVLSSDQLCSSEAVQTAEFVCTADVQSWTEQMLQKVQRDPSYRDQLEGEFFWDLAKDQSDQTNCESDMLSAMNLLSGVGACPGEVNTPKDAVERSLRNMPKSSGLRASRDAYTFQKKVLTTLWNQLPDLSEKKRACEKANGARTLEASRIARKEFTSAGDFESIDRLNTQAILKCGEYDAVYSKVWNGRDPTMRAYAEKLLGRYEAGFRDAGKFFDEALPIDSKTMAVRNAGDIRWQNSFQKDVIQTMSCQTKKRRTFLDRFIGSDGKPRAGAISKNSISGRELKEFLFEDGGVTAFSYLSKNEKYSPLKDGFFCGLHSVYYKGPNRKKVFKTVVVDGVTFVVATGLTVGGALVGGPLGVGLAVSAFVTDGVIAAKTFGQTVSDCSKTESDLATIQQGAMCKSFQESARDPTLISRTVSRLETQPSCAGGVLTTAFAAAGSALSLERALSKLNIGRGLSSTSTTLGLEPPMRVSAPPINPAVRQTLGATAKDLSDKIASHEDVLTKLDGKIRTQEARLSSARGEDVRKLRQGDLAKLKGEWQRLAAERERWVAERSDIHRKLISEVRQVDASKNTHLFDHLSPCRGSAKDCADEMVKHHQGRVKGPGMPTTFFDAQDSLNTIWNRVRSTQEIVENRLGSGDYTAILRSPSGDITERIHFSICVEAAGCTVRGNQVAFGDLLRIFPECGSTVRIVTNGLTVQSLPCR